MPSPEFDQLRDELWQRSRDPNRSLEEMRASSAVTRPRRTTTITPVDVAGVPGEWTIDEAAQPEHRMLYLHGGGYVINSPISHRNLASRLSQAAGVSVLSLGYRLAPETKFPGAVEDATAALAWLRENGPDGPSAPQTLFIGGDSAGGGLTLAALLKTRDAGGPMPDAAVVLSPWTDLTLSGESMETRHDADPFENREVLARYAREYLARPEDAEDPLASPLFADLAGLPPLLIHVGDAEVLLSDSTELAKRAAAAGVDTTLTVFPEMTHVFQAWAAVLPEGREAIQQIGAFLRERIVTSAE